MQPYEKQISSSVINLLKNCPADAVATRKELLVATRHILATEFRKGFFSEVCGVYCCPCNQCYVVEPACGRYWYPLSTRMERGRLV